MKVLHLVKTSEGGTWIIRQVRELVKAGIEVHVALPPGTAVAKHRESGAIVHNHVYRFPLTPPISWPGYFREFRKLVDSIGPDVIHAHHVGSAVTMRLALGRHHPTPRLFQVPGPLHLEYPHLRQGEIRTAGPRDYWIPTCKWSKDRYLRSGVARERLFLTYAGTDVEEFIREERGALRSELGLGPAAKLVGIVAFMYSPRAWLGQKRGLKGHEDLIDALATLRTDDPDIHGVFIGGAWNNALWYEDRVRAYGRAKLGDAGHFLGTRNDVRALYPDLDLAVHPSHSENVGGAVESLLLRVPTITSNVGGFPDLVRDGETGWLVPPKDPAALARAIRAALDVPEEGARRAKRGEDLARWMFDAKRTTADVLNAYDDVTRRTAS